MARILGIDLGINSIGWALVEDNKVTNYGVQVFNTKPTKFKTTTSKIESLKPTIRRNYQLICLTILTLFLFGMAMLTPRFWQFWINLGISGIIAILTIQRKK